MKIAVTDAEAKALKNTGQFYRVVTLKEQPPEGYIYFYGINTSGTEIGFGKTEYPYQGQILYIAKMPYAPGEYDVGESVINLSVEVKRVVSITVKEFHQLVYPFRTDWLLPSQTQDMIISWFNSQFAKQGYKYENKPWVYIMKGAAK